MLICALSYELQYVGEILSNLGLSNVLEKLVADFLTCYKYQKKWIAVIFEIYNCFVSIDVLLLSTDILL